MGNIYVRKLHPQLLAVKYLVEAATKHPITADKTGYSLLY